MTPDQASAMLAKAAAMMPALTGQAIRAAAFSIEADAKNRAPYQTGNLKASISTTMAGPMEAHIGPTAAYGRYVEEGTAPHEIRPKHKKVLHFGGIFTSRVSHPGTRPQPYMTPAVESRVPEVAQALARAMEQAIS